MRQVRRWIVRNWAILTAGFLLTAIAVRAAYFERGYIAFGSEWLVFPVLFIIRAMWRQERKRRCR